MSLSNENIVTRRPTSEPAQITAKPSPGWLESINPFSSKKSSVENNESIAVDNTPKQTESQDLADNDENSTSGWFDFSFKKIAVIIIILLFLGFNVLKMSGEGLDSLSSVFKTLFGSLNIGDTIKKTIDNTADGSKDVIDVTKNTADDIIDDTSELLTGKQKKDHERNKKDNENLAQAVDAPAKKMKNQEVVPDDAGSTLQQSKGAGKAGWCFVGEDRGFRSCVRVGINDDCVSGDIFPSQDICVNPALRE
jgi:hypothetical protein